MFWDSWIKKEEEPGIVFGRYDISYVDTNLLEYWNKSVEAFNEKRYLDCYENFFLYYKRDGIKNVEVKRNFDRIDFKFYQGVKKITGYATNEKIYAEVDVIKYSSLPIPLMRQLLDMNFMLNYSKFAINEDKICMKFTSHTVDCSPWKLHYSLEEMAKKADKEDDVLLEKFKESESVEVNFFNKMDEKEKNIKWSYFKKWMDDCLKNIEKLEEPRLSGAVLYNYMRTMFKVYYLLSPEGATVDEIEKFFKKYYGEEVEDAHEKSSQMKKEFMKIHEKSEDKFKKDLYYVRNTFGYKKPYQHQQIANFINDEYQSQVWYAENGYPDVVNAIFEYVIGYSLSTYGMYETTEKLFHIGFEILNRDYFEELGYKRNYFNGDSLNKKAIEKKIAEIIADGNKKGNGLVFSYGELKYDSLNNFIGTYLKSIARLNYME